MPEAKEEAGPERSVEQAAAKEALAVQFEEYRALRAEVLTNMAGVRQGVPLVFAGVAGLAIGARTVLQNPNSGIGFGLLALPLLYYVLIATQLKYAVENLAIGDYLNGAWRDATLRCLQQIGAPGAGADGDILQWEETDRREKFLRWWDAPIRGATLLPPMFIAMLALVVWASVRWQDAGDMERGLALCDLVLGLACAIRGLMINRKRERRS